MKNEDGTPKDPVSVDNIVFEGIDGEMIAKAAMNTKGSGGPTKVDADTWKQMLCSSALKPASSNLCDGVARLAKRLC